MGRYEIGRFVDRNARQLTLLGIALAFVVGMGFYNILTFNRILINPTSSETALRYFQSSGGRKIVFLGMQRMLEKSNSIELPPSGEVIAVEVDLKKGKIILAPSIGTWDRALGGRWKISPRAGFYLFPVPWKEPVFLYTWEDLVQEFGNLEMLQALGYQEV